MKFPDLVARASRAVEISRFRSLRILELLNLGLQCCALFLELCKCPFLAVFVLRQNVGNLTVAAVAPATQSRRNNIQLDCYWLLEQRDPRAASDYTTEYTTRF